LLLDVFSSSKYTKMRLRLHWGFAPEPTGGAYRPSCSWWGGGSLPLHKTPPPALCYVVSGMPAAATTLVTTSLSGYATGGKLIARQTVKSTRIHLGTTTAHNVKRIDYCPDEIQQQREWPHRPT